MTKHWLFCYLDHLTRRVLVISDNTTVHTVTGHILRYIQSLVRGYRGGIYWGSWVVLSTHKLIIKLLSHAALPVVLGPVPGICCES